MARARLVGTPAHPRRRPLTVMAAGLLFHREDVGGLQGTIFGLVVHTAFRVAEKPAALRPADARIPASSTPLTSYASRRPSGTTVQATGPTES